MCRMLAVFAGTASVSARYWLLGAPDDLQDLSRLNPDGAGIGWFDADGTVRIDRAPLAALDDPTFARDAKHVRSRAVIGHVRHSSGTPRSFANTMPFEREGRLFAHNGALGELPVIEALAGPWSQSLTGDTDSERYLALICHRAAQLASLADGIAAAASELAAAVPILSLNCVMATPDELVAFRYPETDTLWCLLHPAGAGLSGSGSDGPITMEVDGVSAPHIVVASEPLNDDPGWRLLEAGELVHVDASLRVTSTRPLTGPPARLLQL